jgi:hypothetical protein
VQPTDLENLGVEDLIHRSYSYRDGDPAAIELLERAVRLADSQNDIALGWEARDRLMDAATMGGYPEKTLVAFTWNLAQFDRHKEAYDWDEHDLLWKYKWVINSLWSFPSISPAQIEAAFSDFAARLERAGYSRRTLYYFRAKYAHSTGDFAAAEAWRTQWERAQDDALSDCDACEASFAVDYLVSQRDDLAALEAAAPILNGRLRCAEVPHVTLARVLEPMLRLGRADDAVGAHQRGYRMVKDNQEFLVSTGQHLAFLAYTHNLPEALKLFEHHLPWALETADPERRFSFYSDALVLTRRLRDAGVAHVHLRLPKTFAVQPEPDGYNVVALETALRVEASQIAAAFDARNGNTHHTSRLEPDETLLRDTPPVPLNQPESATKNAQKRKRA